MIPHVPQPNLFRALRGPVMLITLGAILAFDHFTRFGFSETWPFLLIVAGVMTLGEHASRRAGSPYSGV
jgi:hypothetical protein